MIISARGIVSVREDAHKNNVFLVVGPLRGGGVKTPKPVRKKAPFSIN